MTELLNMNGFMRDALGAGTSLGLPRQGTARCGCNSRSLSITGQFGRHNITILQLVVPGDAVPAL